MAIKDGEDKKEQFMTFLKNHMQDPNTDLFNISSGRQMQQLLHAPYTIIKKEGPSDEEEQLEDDLDNDDDDLFSDKQANRKPITELPFVDTFRVRNEDPKRGNKILNMSIQGLGIPPIKLTPTGLPSVDA